MQLSISHMHNMQCIGAQLRAIQRHLTGNSMEICKREIHAFHTLRALQKICLLRRCVLQLESRSLCGCGLDRLACWLGPLRAAPLDAEKKAPEAPANRAEDAAGFLRGSQHRSGHRCKSTSRKRNWLLTSTLESNGMRVRSSLNTSSE